MAASLAFANEPAFARSRVFSGTFGKHVDNTTGEDVCTVASGDECVAGEAGSGSGQFSEPSGVAVNNATGNVYVVDKGNNRVQEFDSTGATVLGEFDGAASPKGALSAPEGIAIDNSTDPLDPSAGDVYVVDVGHSAIDKFDALGNYLGQITETEAGVPFGELRGVAVDQNGEVWVYQSNSEIDNFSDALANGFIKERESPFGTSPGIAVDTEDNLYVDRGEHEIGKISSIGAEMIEAIEPVGDKASGVYVDPVANELFIDNLTSISVFRSDTGALAPFIETFGEGHLSAGSGIGVNSNTGIVYVADTAANSVAVFAATPDVKTTAASAAGETTVTLNGSVNPGGVPLSACEFEYGASASYGQSVPCTQTPAEIGTGTASVAVSADVSGLEPLSTYHYRLVAANANGPTAGDDRTASTVAPPAIASESVTEVTADSAAFGAQINAGGLDTTYSFEYVDQAGYAPGAPDPYAAGASTTTADVGSEPTAVAGLAAQQGLQPDTTYHFRVTASNGLGTVDGPDHVFTTRVAVTSPPALPDGRAYEMVSPVQKRGAEVLPQSGTGAALGGFFARGVAQAAADGKSIAYLTSLPIVEAQGSPLEANQVYAAVGPSGWSSRDITPPTSEPITLNHDFSGQYFAFSADLSHAVLQPLAVAPTLSDNAPVGYPNEYLWDQSSNSFQAMITNSVPLPAHPTEGNYIPHYLGTSADETTVVFNSHGALTPNAIAAPVNSPRESNLYAWTGGELQLVNIFPDGTVEGGRAALAGLNQLARHVVSDDGSRIVWENEPAPAEPVALYQRDIASQTTIQLDASQGGLESGGGSFRGANGSGSLVFFTDHRDLTSDANTGPSRGPGEVKLGNDLYVYEVENGGGHLVDLTPDQNPEDALGANVAGVVATSGDGSHIYFVARGVLANGGVSGRNNLYVAHETNGTWNTAFVAVLSDDDIADWGLGGSGTENPSQTSPDGRFLAFMSDVSLTGYDNVDERSGVLDQEIYLYDATSGRITCVSCNPTGARPVGSDGVAAGLSGPVNLSDQETGYQPRVLFDSGRVLFESFDALVAQDVNSTVDVYEWEPNGVGSCDQSEGCIGLISSGTGTDDSTLIDASEEGKDVFFITRERLLPQDVDNSVDLYDAHECTVGDPCITPPGVAPPACVSADACRAAQAPQPTIFGAPASATFSGAGDPAPSRSTSVKPLTRAQKLAKALKACRTKHNRAKRTTCERQTRKRYGPIKAASKPRPSSHKGGK